MADSYEELRIKITADTKDAEKIKQSARDIEQVNKTVIRSLIAQDNEYRAKQKSNLDKSKADEKDWSSYVKSQTKQTADVKIQESKRVADQLKRDNDLIRASEQRRLESVFKPLAPTNPNLQGQSTTLGSIGALQQQSKYYKDYLSTLSSGSPIFEQTKNHLQGINQKLSELQGGTKATAFNFHSLIGEIRDLTIAGFAFGQVFSFLEGTVRKAAEVSVAKEKFIDLAGGIDQAKHELDLLQKASTGNLDEEEIISYSNSNKLLGRTLQDNVQFLDIVERQADATGKSFEEGNAAFLKFIQTGSGKGLSTSAFNVNTLNKEVDRLVGLTKKAKTELDAEELSQIRLTAAINVYGRSLTEISAKQKDIGDSVKSLTSAWNDFKVILGDTFLPVLSDAFKFGGAIKEIITIANQGAKSLSEKLIPSLRELKKVSKELNDQFELGKKLYEVDKDKSLTGLDLPLNAPVHIPIKTKDIRDQASVQKQYNDELEKLTGNLDKNIKGLERGTPEYKKQSEVVKGLNTELSKFNKDISVDKTPRTRKAKELQELTFDKFLGGLKSQITLSEILNKVDQDGLSKELKGYQDLLTVNENLVTKRRDNITDEEYQNEVIKNRTEFLQEQFEILKKINQIGFGKAKVGTTGRPTPANGESDTIFMNGRPFQPANGSEFSGIQGRTNTKNKLENASSSPQTIGDINDKSYQQEQLEKAYSMIVSNSSDSLSNVQSILNALNVGTETFVSQLVTGFQDVLGVVQSLVAVIKAGEQIGQGISLLSSILGFIPGGNIISGLIGTASPASPSGGRNIGNLSSVGRSQPVINKIYISSQVDTQKFFDVGVTDFQRRKVLSKVG